MRVALIGGGSWGCALARLILKKGHLLRWWVHAEDIARSLQEKRQHPFIFPEVVFPEIPWVGTSIQQALEGVDACVLALPARHIEAVLGGLPELPGFWISCTKGLVLGALIQRPSQYLRAKGAEVAVLSGPSPRRKSFKTALLGWLSPPQSPNSTKSEKPFLGSLPSGFCLPLS